MNTSSRSPGTRFRFEKLEIWHDARTLNVEIYRMTQKLPAGESYGLTSQMRRASVSISANIAEGAGRNSDRDFAHFLEQAYASAMELASHIFLASDLGFIAFGSAESALGRINGVAARIAALNRSLKIKTSKVGLERPSTFDPRPSTA
jgi:four helix bundle protein